MRYRLKIDITRLKVGPGEILECQGIPCETHLEQKYKGSIDSALELFREKAEPVGIMEEVSIPTFEKIYLGEGLNQSPAPLEKIFTMGNSLCVFAVTLGSGITMKISDLFKEGDYPVANFLDQAASIGVEKTAGILQEYFLESLAGKVDTTALLVRYSPGYCGWDITGQKKLFKFLRPQEIGLHLNDGSLIMTPLKSISGVMVLGPREIHHPDRGYSFCNRCSTTACEALEKRSAIRSQPTP